MKEKGIVSFLKEGAGGTGNSRITDTSPILLLLLPINGSAVSIMRLTAETPSCRHQQPASCSSAFFLPSPCFGHHKVGHGNRL